MWFGEMGRDESDLSSFVAARQHEKGGAGGKKIRGAGRRAGLEDGAPKTGALTTVKLNRRVLQKTTREKENLLSVREGHSPRCGRRKCRRSARGESQKIVR